MPMPRFGGGGRRVGPGPGPGRRVGPPRPGGDMEMGRAPRGDDDAMGIGFPIWGVDDYRKKHRKKHHKPHPGEGRRGRPRGGR